MQAIKCRMKASQCRWRSIRSGADAVGLSRERMQAKGKARETDNLMVKAKTRDRHQKERTKLHDMIARVTLADFVVVIAKDCKNIRVTEVQKFPHHPLGVSLAGTPHS